MCARLPTVLELRPDEADVDRWRDLAARAAVANPFFEPELVLPAVRHLERGAEVRLAVVQRGGEWIAMAPVVRLSRWRGMPTRAHGTWEHPTASSGLRWPLMRRRARSCSRVCGAAPRSCPCRRFLATAPSRRTASSSTSGSGPHCAGGPRTTTSRPPWHPSVGVSTGACVRA